MKQIYIDFMRKESNLWGKEFLQPPLWLTIRYAYALTSPRVISSSKSTSSSPQARKQLFLHQPLLGESDYLKPGDTVLLVQDDEWRKVVLISHTGKKNQRNDSLYWNRKALDGSNPTGGYLFPGQGWGVLRYEWKDADLSEVDIHFPESLCESRKDI